MNRAWKGLLINNPEILRAIVFANMHPTKTYLYVEKLLAMGACVDMSSIDLEPYLDPKTRQELDSLGLQNPSAAERQQAIAITKLPILLIARKNKDYLSVNSMMDYVDNYQLSLALACFRNVSPFKTLTCFHQSCSGISLYDSQESVDETVAKLHKQTFYAAMLIFQAEQDPQAFSIMREIHERFLRTHGSENNIQKSLERLKALLLLNESSFFDEEDFYGIYMAKILLIIQGHSQKALTKQALEDLLSDYYAGSRKCSETNKNSFLRTIKAICNSIELTMLTPHSKVILGAAEATLNQAALGSVQPTPTAITPYRIASRSSSQPSPIEKPVPTPRPGP